MLCQATKRVFLSFQLFIIFTWPNRCVSFPWLMTAISLVVTMYWEYRMSANFVDYQWPITQMVVSLAASMSKDIVEIKFSSNIFPFYGATVWLCICNVFGCQCFLLYLWGVGSKVIILSFPSISLSALNLRHAPYILSKCAFSLLMLKTLGFNCRQFSHSY